MLRVVLQLALLVIGLLLFPSIPLAGTTCGSWAWANPVPQGNTLNSVTYANGLWVAVGEWGTIITSPDGANWSIQNSGVTSDLKDAAWGAGKWVVVGYQDTILTSIDAVSWTLGHSGVDYNDFECVAYGASVFVASGSSYLTGRATSVDGIRWNPQPGGGFSDILWDGQRFIGVYGGVSESDDGITWTYLASWGPRRVSWNGSLYVGVTTAGWVLASSDAANWTSYNFIGHEFWGIGFGNGLFIAVGRYSSGSGWVYVAETSPDGVTWEEHVLDAPDTPTAVAWGSDRFIAVGWNGCQLASPDGFSWSGSNSVSTVTLNGVVQGGNQFVAAGDKGALLTSPDGVLWTVQDSGTTADLNTVTWGCGQYLAVGWLGTILSSPDGVAWTAQNSQTGKILKDVTWGNSQFVVVGYDVILTSPDGIVWTRQSPPSSVSLNRVVWTGTRFFAVGNKMVAESHDGIQWTLRSFEESYYLYDVVWDGAQFVSCGSFGLDPEGIKALVLTSGDGFTWSPYVGPPRVALYGVTKRGGGQFLAVGDDGLVLGSTDGFSWQTVPSGTSHPLHAVCSHEGLTAVTGYKGTIFLQQCDVPVIPGDCDGDGTVSIGEVQKAINMFLGLDPPGCNVDCDGDGTVSIGEVQKVINAFLGIPINC